MAGAQVRCLLLHSKEGGDHRHLSEVPRPLVRWEKRGNEPVASSSKSTISTTPCEVRVELYLTRPDATENKWLFDQLEREKQKLEDRFGAELQWQRLDGKKASRVCYARPFDGFSEENWPEMIE